MAQAENQHLIDPVCGEPVSVEEMVAASEHGGHSFAFKHIKCKMLFEREPDRYVDAAGERREIVEAPADTPAKPDGAGAVAQADERGAPTRGRATVVVALAGVSAVAVIVVLVLGGLLEGESPGGAPQPSPRAPESGVAPVDEAHAALEGAAGASPEDGIDAGGDDGTDVGPEDAAGVDPGDAAEVAVEPAPPAGGSGPRTPAETFRLGAYDHDVTAVVRPLTSYAPLAEDPDNPSADHRLSADWEATFTFDNGAAVHLEGVFVDYLGRLERRHGPTALFINAALSVSPRPEGGWRVLYLKAPVEEHHKPLRGFMLNVDVGDSAEALRVGLEARPSAGHWYRPPAGARVLGSKDLTDLGLRSARVFDDDATVARLLEPEVLGRRIDALFASVNDATRDLLGR